MSQIKVLFFATDQFWLLCKLGEAIDIISWYVNDYGNLDNKTDNSNNNDDEDYKSRLWCW